jgi:hypothetical protein
MNTVWVDRREPHGADGVPLGPFSPWLLAFLPNWACLSELEFWPVDAFRRYSPRVFGIPGTLLNPVLLAAPQPNGSQIIFGFSGRASSCSAG